MYTPPARRPGFNAPYGRRDRAKTERETIVSRLPLRPPARTPPPVLIRPLPVELRHGSEVPDDDDGADDRAAAPIESFIDPTTKPLRARSPAAPPTATEVPAAALPELVEMPVPNLRPRPQHGLVLALIGLGALAIGAVTAMIAQEVDVPAVAPAPAATPAAPPAAPVVTDLAAPSEPTPASGAITTSDRAPATPEPAPAAAPRSDRADAPRAVRERDAEPARARRPAIARDEDEDEDDDDPAEPTGPGFLTIDAMPYATIYVDGDEIGDTPIIRHELPPGRHHIEAVSSEGGSEQLTVRIQSGETVRRRLGARP